MLSLGRTAVILLFIFMYHDGAAQVLDRVLEEHRVMTKGVISKLVSEVDEKLSDRELSEEDQIRLFDPLINYAEKESATFKKIRERYLKQVPSPPKAVESIDMADLERNDLEKMLKDTRFATVTLLQCYRPEEIAGLINGMVQPLVFQETGTGSALADVAYLFGNQLFVKKLQSGSWQIWLANRVYVIRFELDLSTMAISNLKYTDPNSAEYPQLDLSFVGYPQSYKRDELQQEMNGLIWNSYSMDLLRESTADGLRDTVQQRKAEFYTRHKVLFMEVQNEILNGLDRYIPLASGWKEVVELTEEELQELHSPIPSGFFHPDEVSHHLFVITNRIFLFNQNVGEIGKNAMTGFEHRASFNEMDGAWKVQSIGHSIAFEYQWDLSIGAFKNLKVLRR